MTESTSMKLTLLGTGTPAPSTKRQSSGYLVQIGDETIVLDHGPGAHHRLIEGGFRSTDVTRALFTHLHYDHCMDYARLVLQRWDVGAGKIPDLKVYGPRPLKRMTDSLFGAGGVYRGRRAGAHPASGEPRRVPGAGRRAAAQAAEPDRARGQSGRQDRRQRLARHRRRELAHAALSAVLRLSDRERRPARFAMRATAAAFANS